MHSIEGGFRDSQGELICVVCKRREFVSTQRSSGNVKRIELYGELAQDGEDGQVSVVDPVSRAK